MKESNKEGKQEIKKKESNKDMQGIRLESKKRSKRERKLKRKERKQASD